MILVHRAYQLAVTLYSGCFQADGKPVISHTIGVASILASLDLPPTIVAAGCIHNVYVNGDFGDGLKRSVTPQRQQLVCTAVNPEVESYINRFRQFRLAINSVPEISAHLDQLDTLDRHLLVIDLADTLEKYADQSILYCNYKKHRSASLTDHYSEVLIEMAEQLGYPQLAAALSEAFRVTAADTIPELLVSPNPYAKLVVPLSCRLRYKFMPQRFMSGVTRRLRRIRHRVSFAA